MAGVGLWIVGDGRRPPFCWVAQKCFVRFESVFTGVLLVKAGIS